MGQEVTTTEYHDQDYDYFRKRLREETKIVKHWFDDKVFVSGKFKCGLELESWLVTNDFVPSPSSCSFLDQLGHPLVVPEISKFNFELNSEPVEFGKNMFSKIEFNLNRLWQQCQEKAESLDLKAMTIGTLPTLRDHMLTMENMSPQKRYFALNDQIMKSRDNMTTKLEFEGHDYFNITHDDILTECAATSLQIHYGIDINNAVGIYNSSIIASSFVAATCANAPYFFGKELWDECRIPIFEQSVNLKSFRKLDGSFAKRVGLGNGYVKNSILELFIENLDGYPVLIPECTQSDPNWLDHFRFHNGTIWRWNRPLIGLERDGKPSLRMEFRVPSSGPTIKDSIANMAFQIGLVEYLNSIPSLEEKIPFKIAEENFYSACKNGLDAQVTWIDGKKYNIQSLMVNKLIPGIYNHGFNNYNEELVSIISDVIEPRLLSGQNGTHWQKAFIHTNGVRFQEMLEKYYEFQKANIPVHKWSI